MGDNDTPARAAGSPNNCGGSVTSSGTQQTRFSFYNAQDFIVSGESSKDGEDASKTNNNNNKRFHFYNAEQVQQDREMTLPTVPASSAAPELPPRQPLPVPVVATATSTDASTGAVEVTTASTPPPDNSTMVESTIPEEEPSGPVESAPTSANSLDSIEILRSLQEHEQQRLNILGTANDTTKQPPSAAEPSTNKPEIPPTASANKTAPTAAPTPATPASTNNPYEDAIKEALILLRKHRSPSTADAQRPLSVNTTDTTTFLFEENDGKSYAQLTTQTPPGSDRVLQSRDPAGESPLLFSPTASETTSGAVLGEAYQAEIEARRKQRQERMARYASRLAELKQETAAASNINNPTGWNNSHPTTRDTTETAWGHSHPALVPEQSSQIGSVSTLSNREEESQQQVQLGVERVLLAILDRANSRGRGSSGGSSSNINSSDDDAWRSPEEEKKSTSEVEEPASSQQSRSEQDDALLRAMSDLLRQSTSAASSILGEEDRNRPAGDASHATQDSETMMAAAQHDHSSSASSGGGGGGMMNLRTVKSDPGPEAHEELDRMVERVFQQETEGKRKSSEDELDERVRQVLSKDQNEDDSSREDYTDGSGDEYSDDEDGTAEGTLDDTLEDGLEDDDDDDDEDDDESYESSEVPPRGVNGVLGPLSMMGGTTGVVLEADSESVEDPNPTSLLDSISAAARNLVAGVSPAQSDDSESSESVTSEEGVSEMAELMFTICAHLLAERVAPKKKKKLLGRIPRWDESNPDEPGYQIIRLNGQQLKEVEREFKHLSVHLEEEARRRSGDAEGSFERDLEEAEELLDRQERRKIGEITPTEPWSQEIDESDCLSQFPGVKPAGRGEMGELEFFHLPIVFKSHVTGFEPTKDLYLEAGNVVAGQYLVEGELGSAAFSTAYRCIDLSSDGGPDDHEEVCLKVIKNTKDFFDQSLDEIKILELLRQTGKCHEHNILEMKTFFYHREHLIIVTELLRQNLFEFGKFITDNDEQPYFTITRLSYLTRQTLIALDFVHSIGLVHSDVKPENILLSSYSRARAKLIDFGSSCYLTDRQSSYIQSRSYRAPEVVLGLPYDGRIDIWSLGCVVAEMFTGEVTFQNDSIVSMLSRIESICGKFPKRLTQQGRQSAAYYTKTGLLYEKIKPKRDSSYSDDESSAEDSSDVSFDIFQPKRTTLAARLGFEEDLMSHYDAGRPLSREKTKQAIFVDFCRCLLTIDPEKRPTAAQALQHPWMKYAANLTPEDVKYP